MANSKQTKQQPSVFRDVYQNVTDTIIRQLEKGTVPWLKPWQGANASFAFPQNGTTGKNYQGINIVLLWSAVEEKQLGSKEWASFKQWSTQKENIHKGEKGTMIVYYDTLEKEVDGEIKNIPFLKASYVFNRSQLQSWQPQPPTPLQPVVERLPAIDAFIANTQAIIEHDQGGAYYMPSLDKIMMPYSYSFTDTPTRTRQEAYYSVLGHELIHWTSHPRRLDRTKGRKFGDQAYAGEELIAELGSAFLCAELDIAAEPKEDHASYVAHWLRVLKNDKTFIVKAASDASKAVGYLKDLQPKE